MALALVLVFAAPAMADVCLWRDPDKTMRLVFQSARDYKTVTRRIPSDLRERIESRLEAALDPSERTEWASYQILDGRGQEIGRVIACAQDGEYGVIETVMGVTLDGRVVDVYVQRSRERVNKALKSRDFLGQFKGKTVRDPLAIGNDLQGIPDGQKAAEAVAFAVKKMLVLYSELK